jgi:hypothetical protein
LALYEWYAAVGTTWSVAFFAPMHQPALDAVKRLVSEGHKLHIVPQNFRVISCRRDGRYGGKTNGLIGVGTWSGSKPNGLG